MKYIVTFDIGTTAVKGVLVTLDGQIVQSNSEGVRTLFTGDFKEQNPEDWYEAFCQISQRFVQQIDSRDIAGIIMSGHMQDLIPVGRDGKAIGHAILYSDGRADDQARAIIEKLGTEQITASTGNHMDGSIPAAKLLWYQQNRPEQYQKIHKVLFSSKDYVNSRLTGTYTSDVTTCSTVGLMDIAAKTWQLSWLQAIGLDSHLLPSLRYSDEKVGFITEIAAAETGYAAGTPVYAGVGDAGATTLASGISQDGEFNINLGTSGWVACVSSGVLNRDGVFNLAAMPRDAYINVVPFLNAGNVHKWISQVLAANEDETDREKYEQTDRLLERSVPTSHGLLFLPYLVGERFPVMDAEIKGAYLGITPETTRQDMARAALEGVAFSIRQGLESIGRQPSRITLIGGGARAGLWCQILADVLGHEIIVYRDSDVLPALAISAAVLTDQGYIADYRAFTNSLQDAGHCLKYQPDAKATEQYNQAYQRYCQIYPALKSIS